MADVPLVTTPQVQQSGSPLGISPPPDAFGANVAGEGLQKVGAATEQISDTFAKRAEVLQNLNNKAASDEAWQKYTTGVYGYADQWKESNQRDKAATNLPGAYKTLEDMRQEAAAALPNPEAKAMFDADSRRQFANVATSLSSFAGQQQKQWHNEVAAGAINTASNLIAMSADPAAELRSNDPNSNLQKLFGTLGTLDESNNVPEDLRQANIRKTWGGLVEQTVRANIAQNRIPQALSVLEEHRKDMEQDQYNTLLQTIKPIVEAREARTIALDSLAQITSQGENSFVVGVLHRENYSKWGLNIDKNPNSSASGYGQFLEETFKDVVKHHPEQFPEAKGLDAVGVLALRDNQAVSARAIQLYAHDNVSYLTKHGFQATNTNLGLAHGFGPGGAVALLGADPNAMASDVLRPEAITANRLSGKTVGQVIDGVGSNFGPVRNSVDLAAREEDLLAVVRVNAEKLHPGDTEFAHKAEQEARQELSTRHQVAQSNEREQVATLLEAVQSGATDWDKLNKAVPGASQIVQGFPPSYFNQINSQMRQTDNEPTIARQMRNYELVGMEARAKQGDLGPFLQASLEGLSSRDQMMWYKKQAAVGGRGAKSFGAADSLADKVFLDASGSTNSMINNLFKTDRPANSDPRMYRLQGILRGEIEHWAQMEGKLPTSVEVNTKILPRVFAKSAEFSKAELDGETNEGFSYEHVKAILTKTLGMEPDELSIGTLMARTREEAIDRAHNEGYKSIPASVIKQYMAIRFHEMEAGQ